MSYTCILETTHAPEEMQKLFATELARQHPRSNVTLHERDGSAHFRIDAQDATALRAAVMAITQILGTWDKTRKRT